MATPFSSIYDQALMFIKDYRLINLYNASVTDFETYMQGFLIPAIVDFKNCDQSLAYGATGFTETLTERNIVILAKLLVRYWMEKEVKDVLQMNQKLQDRDFKTYSEAQNMEVKRKLLNDMKEDLSQLLVDYSLDNDELWSGFLLGNFYTPS